MVICDSQEMVPNSMYSRKIWNFKSDKFRTLCYVSDHSSVYEMEIGTEKERNVDGKLETEREREMWIMYR